jgi:F-type H+-transporting ATPase subunit delta
MSGAISRASLAEARERLEAVIPSADLTTLGADLFSVLHLIDREHGLRRALSDPSRSGEDKTQLIRILLEGKIAEPAIELVAYVVRLRWRRASELTDAIERLAVAAEAARAETEGRLDDLEDELFRFSRIIEREPELRGALAGPGILGERKSSLIASLLEGKVTPSALRLITEVAIDPRGRSLERGLAEYERLVAERRSRLVALVRTAVALSEEQRLRLAAALSATYGHDVHLNIELDPTVMGGLSIQIGDEAIDGTIAGRLDDARRRLAS